MLKYEVLNLLDKFSPQVNRLLSAVHQKQAIADTSGHIAKKQAHR